MSRTTLDIDPDVLRELRSRAGREGKSMGQVASEVMATALRDGVPGPPPTFAWRTGDLGRPSVDLEDREAVWAVLDDRA
jgi:hypothetical protein